MRKFSEKDDVKVELLFPKKEHIDLAGFINTVAKTCYEPEIPMDENGDIGVPLSKRLDIFKQLYMPQHHTTMEHINFSFAIEGTSVSSVTFGLHLVHPFYVSDQRSGRFCGKMFENPDIEKLMKYVKSSLHISLDKVNMYETYIRRSLEYYNSLLPEATEIAKKLIKKERPNASEKYIEINAPKMAQEQARMLIPTIFPTGLVYTTNFIGLASLFATSWSFELDRIVELMRDEFLKQWPEFEFGFQELLDMSRTDGKTFIKTQGPLFDWERTKLPFDIRTKNFLKYEPEAKAIEIDADKFVSPKSNSHLHPLDLLQYNPEYMDNSLYGLESWAKMSVATMGQDQRHRTIKRTFPVLTGEFYCPPILREMGKFATLAIAEVADRWVELTDGYDDAIFSMIPYGAMVSYNKKASFNALIHEQEKRLCFCAQEEIYNLNRKLMLSVDKKLKKHENRGTILMDVFEPPCHRTGRCNEGGRYCGKIIGRPNKNERINPIRQV